MIRKWMKRRGVILLAAVLMFSAIAIPKAYAADKIITGEKCSVQISVPADSFDELNRLPVEINLYKVASIDAVGNYTAAGAFSSMDFSDVDSETSAETWEAKALQAKTFVTESMTADAVLTLEEGTDIAEELETGMYLVDAQEIISETYRYKFKPYLISLPNNYYYTENDDEWQYNLTGNHAIGLKAERSDLYGDLVIEKTVDVFNGTYKDATFVFQVEATKADPEAPAGTPAQKVFSDVFAINFTEPNTKSLTVGKIPAGANVIVTEVYSGASYTAELKEKHTVIIADEVLAKDSSKEVAKVSFTNTHDDRPNGGNGIVNSFSYDEGAWNHEATPDSLGSAITPDEATGQITR